MSKPKRTHYQMTRPSWNGQAAYALCTPEINITGYSGVKLTAEVMQVTCTACQDKLLAMNRADSERN